MFASEGIYPAVPACSLSLAPEPQHLLGGSSGRLQPPLTFCGSSAAPCAALDGSSRLLQDLGVF